MNFTFKVKFKVKRQGTRWRSNLPTELRFSTSKSLSVFSVTLTVDLQGQIQVQTMGNAPETKLTGRIVFFDVKISANADQV